VAWWTLSKAYGQLLATDCMHDDACGFGSGFLAAYAACCACMGEHRMNALVQCCQAVSVIKV
jgi:hypothetical protein